MSGDSGVSARLAAVRGALRAAFAEPGGEPWIVAYSGGKDSTLLLQLVWEIAAASEPERRRPVYVVANDTLVESPLVIDHLRRSLDVIRAAARAAGLPITVKVTEPCIDQTFWVNVIGRGCMPPARSSRWCTDQMKIFPINALIRRLVLAYKSTVLLVGTRRSGSRNRGRARTRRGVSATAMKPHRKIENCRTFTPLADLGDDDVWQILMQRRPPWGGSHRGLITLYRNAAGGECPLVLSRKQAPSCGTASPRFGCWTCTVVQKDQSLIDAGDEDEDKLEAFAEFREWLIELREDESNRLPVLADGSTKRRDDGTLVRGPFRLEVRQAILDRLRELEARTGETLLLLGEMEMIEDIWRRDRIREEGRIGLLAAVGLEPEPLPAWLR